MHPVDRRMIEVVGIALQRQLTVAEARDLHESYQYIINREWRLAQILNLMKLARDTKDWGWASELAKEHQIVMKMFY